MPSQHSLDIVNSVFAGQKDLSDYVDSRMKELAVDSIDAMKQDVGSKMFTPPTPAVTEVEPEDSAETTTAETEVTPDATDNGTN
jgi:hypothetical protein